MVRWGEGLWVCVDEVYVRQVYPKEMRRKNNIFADRNPEQHQPETKNTETDRRVPYRERRVDRRTLSTHKRKYCSRIKRNMKNTK